MTRTYFHAPLEFDRYKGGYYYSDDAFEFTLNDISAEDVFYLSAAKTLLSSFEGSPIYKSISEVIDFVTDTQGLSKSSLLKRIAIPPVPKVVTNEDAWKKVIRSLQENAVVDFEYSGRWNPKSARRRVAPYQILMDEGLCFLFGYDLNKKAVRLFALNRMKNYVVTDEHFEIPDDFEFSVYCGGGKFGAFVSEDPVDFIIDFYGAARPYVKERLWADNQKLTDFEGEEKTRIDFSSTQVLKVMEWILAQGANVVPQSPQWFVDDWKKIVKAMMKRAESYINN